jgi:alkanesulfonate monooxygenase SsuD/methylene tetrahydromethanopterin reductase-like flavin-dependent oxidoreductase (luciferase family)
MSVELGIYTFAENSPDPASGIAISAGQRLRNLMEEVELADQVGLDVFGVGEHHRTSSFPRRRWSWPRRRCARSASA